VFATAPLKDAGLVVFVVVGPAGVTVKAVERVPEPVPPVHLILKLLLVAVGKVCMANTGTVGGSPLVV
jgi:hypothetical protein